MADKLTLEQKQSLMASIGETHAVTRQMQIEIDKLQAADVPKIKQVVDSFGPGPHKMIVPQGDGTTKEMHCSFRKHGDGFKMSVTDPSQIS